MMTKLPFHIDLSDKVVVVTGGTGVLAGAVRRCVSRLWSEGCYFGP